MLCHTYNLCFAQCVAFARFSVCVLAVLTVTSCRPESSFLTAKPRKICHFAPFLAFLRLFTTQVKPVLSPELKNQLKTGTAAGPGGREKSTALKLVICGSGSFSASVDENYCYDDGYHYRYDCTGKYG